MHYMKVFSLKLKTIAIVLGLLLVASSFIVDSVFDSYPVSEQLGLDILIFFFYTLLSMVGCFLGRPVFRRWFVFSLYALPVFVILMYLLFGKDGFGGGWGGLKAGYDGLVVYFTVGLYVLVSICIMVFGSLKRGPKV